MELRIDMERSLTDEEYQDHGPPDRITETILRQELKDEVLIRQITVRILRDEELEFIAHVVPPMSVSGVAPRLPRDPEKSGNPHGDAEFTRTAPPLS